MKFFNKRIAFSLTEMLIVLAVVAILFAAAAPIITKKRTSDDDKLNKEPVWNYTNGSHDAYFFPDVKNWKNTLFFGLDPLHLPNGDVSDSAKMVVRANTIKYLNKKYPQRFLQFRYGSGSGKTAGTFFMDSHGNALLGANYNKLLQNGYDAVHNTVMGVGSYNNKPKEASSDKNKFNTIFGSNADLLNSETAKNTLVGANAGRNLSDTSQYNVLIGANSGLGQGVYARNTAIGANTMSNFGADNVYIGTNNTSFIESNNNVISIANPKNQTLSYVPKRYFSEDNTIVGNVDLGHAEQDAPFNGLVVAGANACKGIKSSNTGCIGAESGNGSKYYNRSGVQNGTSSDQEERIYIGGKPPSGMAGGAALEVHNPTNGNGNPTVIMNTNLVVRGELYANGKAINFDEGWRADANSNSSVYSDVYKNAYDWPACRWHGIKWVPFAGCLEWTIGYTFNPACETGDFTIFRPDLAVQTISIVCGFSSKNHIYHDYDMPKLIGDAVGASSFDNMVSKDTFSADMFRRAFGYTWQQINSTNFFKYHTNQTACDPYQGNGSSSVGYCPKVSDLRLKDNLVEYDSGLEYIINLVPFNFTYKVDENKTKQVGVIAQNLIKIFPTAVETDSKGFYKIRWDEMFFAMINSIKSLAQKLEDYSLKIVVMKNDTSDLSSQHSAMNKRVADLNKRTHNLERKYNRSK